MAFFNLLVPKVFGYQLTIKVIFMSLWRQKEGFCELWTELEIVTSFDLSEFCSSSAASPSASSLHLKSLRRNFLIIETEFEIKFVERNIQISTRICLLFLLITMTHLFWYLPFLFKTQM